VLYKRAIKYAPDIPLFSPEPLIHKPSEVSGTAWGKDRGRFIEAVSGGITRSSKSALVALSEELDYARAAKRLGMSKLVYLLHECVHVRAVPRPEADRLRTLFAASKGCPLRRDLRYKVECAGGGH
jgi:hypothetical protein